MAPKVSPTKSEEACPPGLARWMVKHSLRSREREEALAVFDDEFVDLCKDLDDLQAARSKALRIGWENLQQAYKPIIDISMYVLAMMGVILAVAALW